MRSEPTSSITLRIYRVSSTGHRTELPLLPPRSPYRRPLTDAWPECACRRCDPLRRRTDSPRRPF